MCDKKNNVLFTETECLVLSPDFKLLDESQVLLKVPRHNNMFKSKLVRGNLVRGLPSKLFENDHTCVACHKGKQHKASCKTKLVNSICQPLQMLHMDLFGPTSFCGMKEIRREFSIARTPQQNRVAERKNKTLIEAARIMLANSLLPTTFWAEASSKDAVADDAGKKTDEKPVNEGERNGQEKE
ncbi:putative ribonuclease H-like domain-containing protein [Tanacetum coccineum]